MMSPTIRIDDEVYAKLKTHAEPFVDTPNTVIRRLLDLDPRPDELDGTGQTSDELVRVDEVPAHRGGGSTPRARKALVKRKSAKKAVSARAPRAAAGSLLPESSYSVPLLQALEDLGGVAPAKMVVDKVGEKLDGKLTEADYGLLGSGAVRWQNRVQFVRLKLVEDGLMSKDVPRGMWGITDGGREFLKNSTSESGREQ